MNKKMVKKQNHITMEYFLRNYCGIEDEILIEQLTNLAHKELKEVCREVYGLHLTSVSFDSINQLDINNGDILLVYDAYHGVAPYKNPLRETEKQIVPRRQEHFVVDDTFDYDDIIDILEENMTIPDVDVSTIGSFTIKKKRGK